MAKGTEGLPVVLLGEQQEGTIIMNFKIQKLKDRNKLIISKSVRGSRIKLTEKNVLFDFILILEKTQVIGR